MSKEDTRLPHADMAYAVAGPVAAVAGSGSSRLARSRARTPLAVRCAGGASKVESKDETSRPPSPAGLSALGNYTFLAHFIYPRRT